MTQRVPDAQAMLAALRPSLDEAEYVFCTTGDPALAASLRPLGRFEEGEGTTLILDRAAAEAAGFDARLPMRRIVFEVNSALDGVGLTAAVSSALAAAAIACNIVAAYHHDHIFVPSEYADHALTVLRRLQDEAALGLPDS